MKVLLTGATGYIGKRLLPVLVNKGFTVVCAVRDMSRFTIPSGLEHGVEVAELDVLKPESFQNLPESIDAAFYLIHSMSSSADKFDKLEEESAYNFRAAMDNTGIKHVIYMGGISNEIKLSKHLASRKKVEDILKQGSYHFTALRAGIIVGSGSASFEIIRDLVEKLPVMITPRWVLTKSQPIAIRDVIKYLSKVLLNESTFDKNFDIGGPEVLTYKDMLLQFAAVRGLKRWIFTLPIMTPRLSSYWLYFVTATSYKLAITLVNSMKVEVVARPNNLDELLGIQKTPYKEAIRLAFLKVEQNEIISSWKDSIISSNFNPSLHEYINVPTYGCFIDKQKCMIHSKEKVLERLWAIGGETGWYYANSLWNIRGFLDKLVGGVGLRRGRTNQEDISTGDALDFWRIILADKSRGRLLLYAEMKLPGEAWLEFKLDDTSITQTATFRPKGLLGRLYWYSFKPAHWFIFKNMLRRIADDSRTI